MNAGKQDDVREASTRVTVANNKRLLKGRGNSCPDFFFICLFGLTVLKETWFSSLKSYFICLFVCFFGAEG